MGVILQYLKDWIYWDIHTLNKRILKSIQFIISEKSI